MSAGGREGKKENPIISFLRKIAYVISLILRINVVLSIMIVIAVAANLAVMVESMTGYLTGYFGDVWRLAILIVCLAFTLVLFYHIDKFARGLDARRRKGRVWRRWVLYRDGFSPSIHSFWL